MTTPTDTSTPPICLIDAIGPFFRAASGKRLNWSKVPFASLEVDGCVDDKLFESRIVPDFEVFCRAAARMEFTAVTVDDLAHLAESSMHTPALQQRIKAYRRHYAAMFKIAAALGLDVYVTTDLMYYTAEMERALKGRHARIIGHLQDAMQDLFDSFPEVAGIVVRIGESDGVDVRGDFHSRLTIRTPRVARHYLRALLPLHEARGKTLIFRTWSVGAYPIGDLIWNRETYRRTFEGIDSPSLLISMKYGETDFFRFLPLNKQFFRSSHRKIIEVQARREYEGCGKFPSYIGPDYQHYFEQLRDKANVVGIQVWCQTGGWTKFRALTFIRNSSPWNEINTFVALRMFRDGQDAEAAVRDWHADYVRSGNPDALVELLALSDQVVKELLYIDDFARRKIFFRRLRVPPLIATYWDHVIVNDHVKAVLRCFVANPAEKLRQGQDALRKIDRMIELLPETGMENADLSFMRDTFEILAASRAYYFGKDPGAAIATLRELKSRYRTRQKRRYSIHLDFRRSRIHGSALRLGLKVLLRHQRGYRSVLDRLFTLRLLAVLYPLLQRLHRHRLPAFARDQAMGVDTVFK